MNMMHDYLPCGNRRSLYNVTMNRRLVLRKTKAPKFKEKLTVATDVIVDISMHFFEPDASTV